MSRHDEGSKDALARLDQLDIIPFDDIEAFYREHLGA